MPAPLSGPGLGLQLPQNLYPSELFNAPYDTPTNSVALSPGDVLPIPAGNWYVSTGMYSVLQFLNPITGTWTMASTPGWLGSPIYVKSDGFNYRIANLLACPVSASIKAYGSGYVQSSTTLTATPGLSTWLPIIGGQLGTVATFSLNITNVGGGYGIAPIVLIAPPPPAGNNPNGVGGIPAAGFVTIAGGTVSGFSFTNPGAGYPSAPAVVVLPSPFDPNIASGITQASLAFSVTGAGSITGALCTNSAGPLATVANFSLVLAGAGSAGSVVANILQTIVSASVSGVGTGYPVSGTALLTTVGGAQQAGTITNNPDFLNLAFRPRPADIGITSNSGGTLTTQLGTIYDGGLFLSAPGLVIAPPATGSVALATVVSPTISFTMGSTQDHIMLQPAP
jgi:hypothetical protein